MYACVCVCMCACVSDNQNKKHRKTADCKLQTSFWYLLSLSLLSWSGYIFIISAFLSCKSHSKCISLPHSHPLFLSLSLSPSHSLSLSLTPSLSLPLFPSLSLFHSLSLSLTPSLSLSRLFRVSKAISESAHTSAWQERKPHKRSAVTFEKRGSSLLKVATVPSQRRTTQM